MRSTDYNAPYGECKCGFKGLDWSFHYQGLCSKCYGKWRKQKALERKLNKLPNDNIQIADNAVVTRNVFNKLQKTAREDIPYSLTYSIAEKIQMLSGIVTILIFLAYLKYGKEFDVGVVLVVLLSVLGIGHVSYCCMDRESRKRQTIVTQRLEQLAYERKLRMEEMQRFYQSAEWRLLRAQIIKEKGNVCTMCGKRIKDLNDITVDHILPRSKFADKALDRTNMQVLCRSCNSSKGDSLPDEFLKRCDCPES